MFRSHHPRILIALLAIIATAATEKVVLHCEEEAFFPPSAQCTYNGIRGSAGTKWILRHDTTCANFLRPPNVNFVSITNSDIEQLPSGLLGYFESATTLSAPANKIRRINLYNFENGTRLQTLNVPYNDIKLVPNMVFVEAPNLVTIDLSHNAIATVEEQAFYGLRSLRSLDLSFNKLASLEPATLSHLSVLEVLLLNSNTLDRVPEELLLNNANLRDVDLSKNAISSLSGNHFANILNLCLLNLDKNRLKAFDSILKANKLVLSNNQIESISIAANVLHIDAKNNRIAQIKCSPGVQITDLVLRNNALKDLGKCIPEMNELQYLDVSVNNLAPLKGTELEKLANLRDVELANTTLKTFSKSTFAQNKKLKSLNLANNDMKTLDFEVIEKNPSLTHLYLEGNDFVELDVKRLKRSLPQLSVLGIARNNWECAYLRQVLQETKRQGIKMYLRNPTFNASNVDGIACTEIFKKPVKSEKLVLAPNYLREAQYDAFSGRLSLGKTHTEKLPDGIFQAYPNTKVLNGSSVGLKSLARETFMGAQHLEILDLSSNIITELPNTVFADASNLKHIRMSNAGVQEISDQAFYGLEHLKKLELPKNKVKRAAPSFFEPLPALEELDMAENNLWSIEEELFSQNPKLKKVSLANNMIEVIEGRPFRNIEDLEELNLNGNLIDDFTTDGLRVRNLNIKDNQIQKLYHTGNVTTLDAQNNDIKTVICPTNYDTESVNMRNNSLTDLTGISWMKGLKKLDVSQNKIGVLIPADFKYLSNLEYLNISQNQLAYLAMSQFQGQGNLRVIDLSKNNLRKLDMSVFKSMKQIEGLYIGSNKISELPNFDTILPKLSSEAIIDLSNNLFNCSYVEALLKMLPKNVMLANLSPLQPNVGGIKCNPISGWKPSLVVRPTLNSTVLQIQSLDFQKNKTNTNKMIQYYLETTGKSKNISDSQHILSKTEDMEPSVSERKSFKSTNFSTVIEEDSGINSPTVQIINLPASHKNSKTIIKNYSYDIEKEDDKPAPAVTINQNPSGKKTKTVNYTTVIEEEEPADPIIYHHPILQKFNSTRVIKNYTVTIEEDDSPEQPQIYFQPIIQNHNHTRVIKNFTIVEETEEDSPGQPQIHYQPIVQKLNRTRVIKNYSEIIEGDDSPDQPQIHYQPIVQKLNRTRVIKNYTEIIEEDDSPDQPEIHYQPIVQKLNRTRVIKNYTEIIEEDDSPDQPEIHYQPIVQKLNRTRVIKNYTEIIEKDDSPDQPQIHYQPIVQKLNRTRVIKNYTEIIEEDDSPDQPEIHYQPIVQKLNRTRVIKNYTEIIEEDDSPDQPEIHYQPIVQKLNRTRVIKNYTEIIEEDDSPDQPQIHYQPIVQKLNRTRVIKNYTEIIEEDDSPDQPQIHYQPIVQKLNRTRVIKNYTEIIEEDDSPDQPEIHYQPIVQKLNRTRVIKNYTEIIEEDDSPDQPQIHYQPIVQKLNRTRVIKNYTEIIEEDDSPDQPQIHYQPIVQKLNRTRVIKNYTEIIEEDDSPEQLQIHYQPMAHKLNRTRIIKNYTEIIEEDETPEQPQVQYKPVVQNISHTRVIKNFTQVLESESPQQTVIKELPSVSKSNHTKIIKNFTEIVEDSGEEPTLLLPSVAQPKPVKIIQSFPAKVVKNFTYYEEEPELVQKERDVGSFPEILSSKKEVSRNNASTVAVEEIQQPHTQYNSITVTKNRTKIVKNFTLVHESGGDSPLHVIKVQPVVPKLNRTRVVLNYTQVYEEGKKEAPQVVRVVQEPTLVTHKKTIKVTNYTTVLDESESPEIVDYQPAVQRLNRTKIIKNYTYYEEEPKPQQKERQIIQIPEVDSHKKTVIIKNLTQVIDGNQKPAVIHVQPESQRVFKNFTKTIELFGGAEGYAKVPETVRGGHKVLEITNYTTIVDETDKLPEIIDYQPVPTNHTKVLKNYTYFETYEEGADKSERQIPYLVLSELKEVQKPLLPVTSEEGRIYFALHMTCLENEARKRSDSCTYRNVTWGPLSFLTYPPMNAATSPPFNSPHSINKVTFVNVSMPEVPSGLFEYYDQTKVLKARNSSVQDIYGYTFRGAKYLVELDLSVNYLTKIPQSVLTTPSLLHLNLSYNYISIIEQAAFKEAAQILNLDLSHNAIKVFNVSEVQHLIALQTLNLNNNLLTQLDVARLPAKLIQLGIDGNLFNCSYLENILNQLRLRNISLIPNGLEKYDEAALVEDMECVEDRLKSQVEVLTLEELSKMKLVQPEPCPSQISCCEDVKDEITALKMRYDSLQAELENVRNETLKETQLIVDEKVGNLNKYLQEMVLKMIGEF